jgi:hypothetical protein
LYYFFPSCAAGIGQVGKSTSQTGQRTCSRVAITHIWRWCFRDSRRKDNVYLRLLWRYRYIKPSCIGDFFLVLIKISHSTD